MVLEYVWIDFLNSALRYRILQKRFLHKNEEIDLKLEFSKVKI